MLQGDTPLYYRYPFVVRLVRSWRLGYIGSLVATGYWTDKRDITGVSFWTGFGGEVQRRRLRAYTLEVRQSNGT